MAEERQGTGTDTAENAAASRLRERVEALERRLHQRDDQRRAMLHIMGDLNDPTSARQSAQAMIHIRETCARPRPNAARGSSCATSGAARPDGSSQRLASSPPARARVNNP